MKDVTPENGAANQGQETPSEGPSPDAERVLKLAAVLDPAAFDDDVPKSKMQVAQLQWAARRHMAMESAGRAVAAGWLAPGDLEMAVDQIYVAVQAIVDRAATMNKPDPAAVGDDAAAPEKWTWTKGDVVLFCDGDVWQRVNDSESGVWRDTDGNGVEDEHVTAEMTDCRGRALVCQAREDVPDHLDLSGLHDVAPWLAEHGSEADRG